MAKDSRPLLVFFGAAHSGPARRMESLMAHLARKERDRLRVTSIGNPNEMAVARVSFSRISTSFAAGRVPATLTRAVADPAGNLPTAD